MTEGEILAAIRELLEPLVESPALLADIGRSTSLRDDLDISSVHYVDLLLEVENRFQLRFADSELQNLTTVGAWIDLIQTKQVPS